MLQKRKTIFTIQAVISDDQFVSLPVAECLRLFYMYVHIFKESSELLRHFKH